MWRLNLKTKKYKDDKPPLKDCSDIEYPINREALVIKRLLDVWIKNDDVE